MNVLEFHIFHMLQITLLIVILLMCIFYILHGYRNNGRYSHKFEQLCNSLEGEDPQYAQEALDEPVEIKEEQIEDYNIEKVFFEPSYEPSDEFVYSPEEDYSSKLIEKTEEQEVKPEPVESKPNKVLNYFK